MKEEKKSGFKIVVRDYVAPADRDEYIAISPNRKLEFVMLDCLAEQYVIEVAAISLYDAIDKILYALDALSGARRQFFLSQIAIHLKEVSISSKKLRYEISENISNIIREDKLYRIHAYEDILIDKGENLWN